MNKENLSAENAQVKTKGVQKGLIIESKTLYGMYVSPKTAPDVVVLKCNEQIENCNRWITNVTALKAEQEALVIQLEADRVAAEVAEEKERKEDRKAWLISCIEGADDINEMIAQLQAKKELLNK